MFGPISTSTHSAERTGSRPAFVRHIAVGAAAALMALAVAVAPTSGISHAYNTGVKSVHFSAAADSCEEGYALPCTPGAGVGQANVMRVTQSKVNGYNQFTALEGTSLEDAHLWIAANLGVECRRFYDIVNLRVDDYIDQTGDQNVWGFGFGGSDSDDIFPMLVPYPDARVMPTKKIAVNVPISVVFNSDLIASFPTVDDVLAAGEAEIDRRVAQDGMTYNQARALPFEIVTEIRLVADAWCDRFGRAVPRSKRVLATIPLTIEFVPVDAVGGSPLAPLDEAVPSQVTDVDLAIVADPADSCTLHLSGTIVTNGPVEVDYRWVNLEGLHSATQSVVIGESQVGFVSQEIEIPAAPLVLSGPGIGFGGNPAGDLFNDNGAGTYDDVYELQVLSPNSVTAVEGFSVPYCHLGPR